jgi:transglutaminase-like putative cysteine protease
VLFAIHYVTEYHYGEPVTDNLNALRVRPATTATQRCDEFHVRTDPESRLGRHADYFGTEVIEFGISRPHSSLTIDVRARVVTSEPAEPPAPAWDALAAPAYREAAGEYLLASIAEPPNGELDELVALSELATPLESVEGLCELIPDRFEYNTGITYVGSTVADLLRAARATCSRHRPTAATTPSRSRRMRGSRRCCPTAASAASRSGSASTRPTARAPASST